MKVCFFSYLFSPVLYCQKEALPKFFIIGGSTIFNYWKAAHKLLKLFKRIQCKVSCSRTHFSILYLQCCNMSNISFNLGSISLASHGYFSNDPAYEF